MKSPEGANETIEQKQQRPNKYKDLLIISAPVKDDSDESSSVLCLITLPEDEPSDPTMPPQNEQVTIRMDVHGTILQLDRSSLRPQFANFLTKEIGRSINEICHYQDRHRLQVHMKEVNQIPSDPQTITYRLKMGTPDLYIPCKVQSRMFSGTVQDEPDFIMSLHTLLTEGDGSSHESLGLHGSSSMLSMLQPQASPSMSMSLQQNQFKQLHHGSSMGGPLMTSVTINGGLSQMPPRNGQNSSATNNNSFLNDNTNVNNGSGSMFHQQSSSSSAEQFFTESFDFIDFPTSTFEVDNNMFLENRPDSRASITPVSTPRPASATAYSPAPPMCPSPLTPYHGAGSAGQPSPSNISNNNNNSNMVNNNLANNNSSNSSGSIGNNFTNNTNNNSSSTNNNSSSSNFSFPFDDKEKVQEQIQHQLQKQQQDANSEKLRHLLTKNPHTSGSGMESSEDRNQILKVGSLMKIMDFLNLKLI